MAAEDYDDLIDYASLPPETAPAVPTLARLAGRGRILELGVGTGRLAIPLAATGCEVHGIELDPTMIEVLRTKQGGERVICHEGDMAAVDVQGPFDLVFAAFGTLFALPDQASQVRCFRNVTDKLTSDGIFLIEALVPRPAALDIARSVSPAGIEDGRVVLNVSETDPVRQTIHNQQIVISETGTTFHPIRIRYSWPAELDLMAQLAGLQLQARWSDWDQTPFETGAPRHISLYTR